MSEVDALERKSHETKLSQYSSFDAEKVMVEQGFCNLIPRFLNQLKTDDHDHDIVEKTIQAMISLRQHCHQDFLSVRPIISLLKDRFVSFQFIGSSANFQYSNTACYYSIGTGIYRPRKSIRIIQNLSIILLNCIICVRNSTAHSIEKNYENL